MPEEIVEDWQPAIPTNSDIRRLTRITIDGNPPGSCRGPLRIIDDVEYATMAWVDWFNNRRLHSVLDYVPPEEYESAYYPHIQGSQPATPQP
jgi:transposase InsO family protein